MNPRVRNSTGNARFSRTTASRNRCATTTSAKSRRSAEAEPQLQDAQ
jgi:hypothetical protein